ncbi:MAG TPA: MarR family transcriptional regulator [Phenylobacterium sp.]|nr:MarR family transcriptional regulator [Phenylobacterium sp.]
MPSDSPRTIYLIWKANQALKVLIDIRGRGAGVTLAQYTILSLLRGRAELSAAAVARRIGISPQAANETVSALESAGLIEKRRPAANRKVLHLALTEDGLEHLRRAERVIDDAERAIFGDLSADEMAVVRVTMSRIIESAAEVAESGGRR